MKMIIIALLLFYNKAQAKYIIDIIDDRNWNEVLVKEDGIYVVFHIRIT